MDSEATGDPVTLELLAREIGDLRDLFQRRLLTDQVQKRLFDELHNQLELGNGRLVEQILAPVLRQVILVIDRIERQSGSGELVESIRLELLEVLARQGVARLDPIGQPFDPQRHQAVGLTEVGNPAEDGVVVGHARVGYLIQDRVLRPAEVEVGRYAARPAAPATADNGG